MRRVLFTATLVRGHIAKFHIPYLKLFKEQGWETWVAAKNDYDGECNIPYCDYYVDIPFARSPCSAQNIRAFNELKCLLNDHSFDLIHTHTPVGSVLTRLAARDTRESRGTKVFYTAHGFHFYRGAPLQNWILWFPIEKLMTKYTDVLICINNEDYSRAKRFAMCKVERANGTGVSAEIFKYDGGEGAQKERELFLSSERLPDSSKILLAVGDVNKNKNHKVLIESLEHLDSSWHLIIAGDGPLTNELREYARDIGLYERVRFLGFRNDIPMLMRVSDVFCLPSHREGLPISLIEAMLSGTPCVVSNIRGSSDVLKDFPKLKVQENSGAAYASAIELASKMAGKTFVESASVYQIDHVLREYIGIYSRNGIDCCNR